jgi:hypothetical protein
MPLGPLAITLAIDLLGFALMGYFAYKVHRVDMAIVGILLDLGKGRRNHVLYNDVSHQRPFVNG